MKKSELKRLVVEYNEIKIKFSKLNDEKLMDKIEMIEHRYYHETGKMLKSDLEKIG